MLYVVVPVCNEAENRVELQLITYVTDSVSREQR
jgi:hypothetical protein